MNRRAELQLRLQQTVEGLSVIAISYYLVGLFSYLIKAIGHDPPIDASIIIGLFVPIAVLLVWITMRRIRKNHATADVQSTRTRLLKSS
jgi:uncharacterized membrane-anchored protein